MFDSRKLAHVLAARRRFAAALGSALVLALAGTAGSARAHYILLKPDAMFNQDMSGFGGGAPQKGAPCGPGGFDDDGSGTATNKVTEVKAGDTLHVTWMTTIDHDGYFRIALAKDPSEFADPIFTDPVLCDYDKGAVKSGAHDNILMDNIASSATSQDVKIPDSPPCTDCTLQVIQVMYKHGPPNCIYYHCAALRVMPKDGATAGSGGMAGSAGSGGSAGSSGMGGMGGGAAGGGQAGSSAAGSAAAGTTGAAGMAVGQGGNPAPMGGTSAPPTQMMMQPVSGNPPSAGAGGVPAAPAAKDSSDDGGCAVLAVGDARSPASLLLLGLALAALMLRRVRPTRGGASRPRWHRVRRASSR